jgi:hypothetical protein
MRIIRITAVLAAFLAVAIAFTMTHVNTAKAKEPSIARQDTQKPLQAAVASKTARFATVDKADTIYKTALDAHDFDGAHKLVGQTGALKGTVSKFFEERDGDLVIFDFDPNYKTAMTAILRNPDFPKFPDIHALEGKEIVVTGKFIDYRGKAQLVLTDPEQIKLVK